MTAILPFSCFCITGDGFYVNESGDYDFAGRNGKIFYRIPCRILTWIPFISAVFLEIGRLMVVEVKTDQARPAFNLRIFDVTDYSWVEETNIVLVLPNEVELTINSRIHIDYSSYSKITAFVQNPGHLSVLQLDFLTSGRRYEFKVYLQSHRLLNPDLGLIHRDGPQIVRNRFTREIENIIYSVEYIDIEESLLGAFDDNKRMMKAQRSETKSVFVETAMIRWVVEKNLISVLCKVDEFTVSLVQMNTEQMTFEEIPLSNKFREPFSFIRDPVGLLCMSYLDGNRLVLEPLSKQYAASCPLFV